MNIQGTVTGRAQLALPNVEDLPRGCYYMTTTNRTQLEAAIRSVDEDGTTVIDAVNERGKKLVRYTFRGWRWVDKDKLHRHLARIANQVRRTPAHYWR